MTQAQERRTIGGPATREVGGLAIAAGILVIVAFTSPLLALSIALIGLAATHRSAVPLTGFATVAILTSMLAWLNTGKEIRGDWVWYTTHYQYLETLPLDQYLGQRIGQYNPDVTEPVYYSISRFVSSTTGANIEALAVVVTVLIYGCIGVAVVLAASTYTEKRWTLVAATTAGVLTGITFTLSTQLVRQEIAAAFIGLGIVLVGLKKPIPGAIALVLACLTHNSAVIPAAGLALAVVLARADRGWFLRVVVSAGIFYALGRIYLVQSGNNLEGRSDGAVSLAVIALDGLIAAVFAFLVLRGDLRHNAIARTVLLCLPAFYGFMIAVISQPIPLLRMYFYLEILRALMVTFLVIWAMRGRVRVLVGLIVVAAAVAQVQLRIASSPFAYELDVIGALFGSPLFPT